MCAGKNSVHGRSVHANMDHGGTVSAYYTMTRKSAIAQSPVIPTISLGIDPGIKHMTASQQISHLIVEFQLLLVKKVLLIHKWTIAQSHVVSSLRRNQRESTHLYNKGLGNDSVTTSNCLVHGIISLITDRADHH